MANSNISEIIVSENGKRVLTNPASAINLKLIAKALEEKNYDFIMEYVEDRLDAVVKGINSAWIEIDPKKDVVTCSYTNSNGDIRENISVETIVSNLLSKYAEASRLKALYAILNGGNLDGVATMRKFIENPIYSILVTKVSTQKIDGETITSMTTSKKDIIIDVYDLDKFCGDHDCKTPTGDKGIGASSEWKKLMELFNIDFTIFTHVKLLGSSGLKAIADKVYGNFKFKKKLEEVCRVELQKYNDGEDYEANPCSASSLKKTLTALVNALVGEDYTEWANRSCDGKDFALIREGYATASKDKRGLKCPKTSDMAARVIGMLRNVHDGTTPYIEYFIKK